MTPVHPLSSHSPSSTLMDIATNTAIANINIDKNKHK